MDTPSQSDPPEGPGDTFVDGPSPRPPGVADRQLLRWGAVAGLAGVILFIGTVVVVAGFGLPNADDVETLRDFADIESGRIAEHFLYLGSIVLFALQAFVLQRLLSPDHRPAALFGTVLAAFGYVIMAASSMLHVSTAPLSELYTAPDASAQDQRAIEYAWHGTQSVFDTMLLTGVLLVPIGMILFGVAMRRSPAFGSGLTALTLVLGILALIGVVIEVVDTSTDLSAIAVLSIVIFNGSTGWRLWQMGKGSTDVTDWERG